MEKLLLSVKFSQSADDYDDHNQEDKPNSKANSEPQIRSIPSQSWSLWAEKIAWRVQPLWPKNFQLKLKQVLNFPSGTAPVLQVWKIVAPV